MMSKITHFLLKFFRKIYFFLAHKTNAPILPREMNVEENEVSNLIYETLISDKPCMIARFGSFELNTVLNCRSVQNGKHQWWKFIKGENQGWWWNKKLHYHMENNAGFYPITEKSIIEYEKRMTQDIQQLDILGSFARNECLIENEISNVVRIPLKLLEPFYGKTPWTKALEGKKVLVVHPLAKLIECQYKNREKLFKNKNLLPNFQLYTIEAVQSLGGKNSKFSTWFQALKYMEEEIDKIDYDICLIGCGAYGFCLAAHVKRSGKKAFHLGGVLQLLFGIYGKRWEDPNYNVDEWDIPTGFYSDMINEYWIRPGKDYIPSNATAVEGACYW